MSKAPNAFSTSSQETLAGYSVELLPRSEINTSRWDKCIENAHNETPLAYSWVLDHLTPGWQGLILGNYEGVMPLPIVKQFGFLNIQMPPEVLTLGIFSQNPVLNELFPEIFKHNLFSSFQFIHYNGNPLARKQNIPPEYLQKQTFELNLNHKYNFLFQQYSRTHKRNIKIFHNSGLIIEDKPCPEVFTSLIKEIGKSRSELLLSSDYREKFTAMTISALKRGMGKTMAVWKDNQLIGGAFFLIGKNRIIPYHLANDCGRSNKTSFAIMDQFIREHSEQNKILDFAGSVLPNVAEFNRRFGAIPAPYLSYKVNRLPQPFKWAKEKNLLFNLKRLFFK